MVIRVCGRCEHSQSVRNAALNLQKQFGAQITVEFVECLDQCHYPPVASVNGQLIIWADAVKLNTAVARLMHQDG